MAVYPNIKFYRRQEAPSNPQEGYIWFDVINKRLKIYKSNDWEDYSGKLVDASFASNILTITKQDGSTVSVDVSGLTAIDSKISAAINNLDATVGSTSFNQNTTNAVTTAHVAVQVDEENGKLTKVTVAENDIASASTLSALTNTVSDLSDVIDVIKGSDTGSIRDIAIDVLTETLVKDNAADAYDTLQEMSEWIQNHPENAAAMNTKVSNLETAVSNLQKADSVTTFGDKTGAITLKDNSTTNGTVNFTMNDNELTGTVYGLGSAAYTASTAYATSAQGGKADSALQSVSSGNTSYLTVSTKASNGQTVTPVMGTFGSTNGLATTDNTAAYVNTYVDTVFSWAEY